MSGPLRADDWLFHGAATLFGDPDLLEEVAEVVTDSRETGPGRLFLTLAGQRSRGWDYLDQAIERGCRAFWGPVEAEAALASLRRRHPEAAVLVSERPLEDLQRLARHYLERKTTAYRIGITGSQGKTSVKEMIRTVLAAFAPTWAAEGNRNTVISLPGAALTVGSQHRYAVFELGIDRPGEMDSLVEMIQPHAAVITGIGTAHAEHLGGREGIAREKGKIASRLPPDGILLLPSADDFFSVIASRVTVPVQGFGEEDFEPGSLQVTGWNRTRFRYKGHTVELPLGGRHFALDALAALKLVEFLGLNLGTAAAALGRVTLPSGRVRYVEGPVNVVDDSYNASLQSVEALLDTLESLPRPTYLAVVLGSMKELGDLGPAAHRQVGSHAARIRPDLLVWVGEEARWGFEEAAATYRGEHRWFRSVEEAVPFLVSAVPAGATLVVKGSRSVRLDEVVNRFVQESPDAV